MPRISIIMPTIGRNTLARTMQEALVAMGEEDELLVVADGPNQRARRIAADNYDCRCRYLETWHTGHWGAEQIDFGAEVATGDVLMLASDDDVMPAYAVEAVRRGVDGALDKVHVFAAKLHHWNGRVLADDMRAGTVTGQQVVVPRIPRARYADDISGLSDHAFLVNSLAVLGQDEPIYHPDIISEMHNHNSGRMF